MVLVRDAVRHNTERLTLSINWSASNPNQIFMSVKDFKLIEPCDVLALVLLLPHLGNVRQFQNIKMSWKSGLRPPKTGHANHAVEQKNE